MDTKTTETIESPAKVKMTLDGVDGNVFAVLGTFQRHARRQGWTKEQIEAVLHEAESDDYDHAIATILNNIDEPEEHAQGEDSE